MINHLVPIERPSRLRALCCAFVCVILGTVSSLSAALPFSQTILDAAANEPLLEYNSGANDGGVPGWQIDRVKRANALYLIALAASLEPTATCQSGAQAGNTFASRLSSHIYSLFADEPNCNGGLEGWSHNQVAQTLALIRTTPALWAQYNTSARNRMDWLMKAMTVAGAWCYNDVNNFNVTLDFKGTANGAPGFGKNYGVNYREGYVGVMVASASYFGSQAAVDAILTGFNYDTYQNTFTTYGWSNISYIWALAGKARMENGTTDDGFAGSGAGVRAAFVYSGQYKTPTTTADPVGLYVRLAEYNFVHPFVAWVDKNGNSLRDPWDNTTWPRSPDPQVNDTAVYPFDGLTGMMRELRTSDAKGLRSSATYCFKGWMNTAATSATLKRSGKNLGSILAALRVRMIAGADDLVYKVEKGYNGYQKGAYSIEDVPYLRTWGYDYVHEVWYNYVEPSL
jgi:hypothetical protein